MHKVYLQNNCTWEYFLDWLGNTKLDSGAKNTKDLFEECTEGESKLYKHNDTIYREVHVVKLKVQHPTDSNLVLIESEQHLPGQENPRYRNIYPSEKCKQDELPYQTAVRGLKEELLFEKDYKINFERQYSEKKISTSYYELETTYYIYVYNVDIENSLFKSQYTIKEEDGKISVFTWQNREKQQDLK